MLESLKTILAVQEFDVKMIRLIRLKKDRRKELEGISDAQENLANQCETKNKELLELKVEYNQLKHSVDELSEQIKKHEAKQNSVKKVEEFNALNQEISTTERKRSNIEQYLKEIEVKCSEDEAFLEELKTRLKSNEESNKGVKKEINTGIAKINEEGLALQKEREKIAKDVDPAIIEIYEKLLKSKRDRVVVPIEKRCCRGCNILLTPQHENLVRRAERLVFCEHCSRVLYWQKDDMLESVAIGKKPRRRRRKAS